MANCAYHPERDAVGACVNCGRLICAECKVVLAEKIYCNPCGDELFTVTAIPLPQAEEKVTYNSALRWASGVVGFLFILVAIGGLLYFAESGLVSELIVDIVTIIIAIACLVMAFVPQWVSARLKVKLEKGSVFGIVLGALVVIFFIVTAIGPEPPGGWWNYGEPLREA